MQKLNFSIDIKAPKEKVWKVLWEDATYTKWTSVFCEGSQAITDWNEGSKVLFIDGKGSGMVSRIETKKPHEFISFKHLGEVKNGEEDTTSEKVKQWAGAFENYTLNEKAGITTLVVDMDIAEEFKDYFMKTFPGGLDQVKLLSEA
ncbi:MAG: SRPBCC domain-containing protein [Ginsengibacter sp.]